MLVLALGAEEGREIESGREKALDEALRLSLLSPRSERPPFVDAVRSSCCRSLEFELIDRVRRKGSQDACKSIAEKAASRHFNLYYINIIKLMIKAIMNKKYEVPCLFPIFMQCCNRIYKFLRGKDTWL